MPDATNKAVFLSYASQDAVAARSICDSLRAAGVEVWFDQSELRGGDAWDAKIRKQIKECALFVPLISANTQARLEGYFRLEWKLAAQRTHTMADAKPFLLPVCIDDIRDADAHVPEEFRAVQWTRLRSGEMSAEFCARVKMLLDGSGTRERFAATHAASETLTRSSTSKGVRLRSRWVVALVFGAAAIGVIFWQPWRKPIGTRRTESAAAAPSTTADDVARLRAQLIPHTWKKEDFEPFSAALDRIISADEQNADAWALRSIINSLQVIRNYEAGTKPLDAGRLAANRALHLAPDSGLAELALGMHLTAMNNRGGDSRIARPHLLKAFAVLPRDALTRFADVAWGMNTFEFDEMKRAADEWLRVEPTANHPAFILAMMHEAYRQPLAALQWAERGESVLNISGARSFVVAFEVHYYLRADLKAARATLERVPAGAPVVHRMLHARWLLAMAERRFDVALQELARTPETLLYDRSYRGPKALLAGLAHQALGNADTAQVHFREAERILHEQLAADGQDQDLHAVAALTLACLDQPAAARRELAWVEPLVRGRNRNVATGNLMIHLAQTYAVLGQTESLCYWLRELMSGPLIPPFTPASLRIDPRFQNTIGKPEVQKLLSEFAHLDAAKDQAPNIATSSFGSDAKSVAVLAFDNLSDDKANEYFSDGISEELINVLGRVPGLTVKGRTSAFFFKGNTKVSSAEIAQQLGVTYLVRGSVRKSGNKVRITAQLTRAANDEVIWSSQPITKEVADAFTAQEEIAALVAQSLQLKLGIQPAASSSPSAEALRLYLEGRQIWNLRTRQALDRAEALFNQALALDPKFARARVGRADVWMQRYAEFSATGEDLARFANRRSPLVAKITAEAEAALTEDPTLAEAHTTIGNVLGLTWQDAAAEEHFRRALSLNPNYATTHHWLGRLLLREGRMDEARTELAKAADLDPLSPIILDNYAMVLLFSGDAATALPVIERALLFRPDSVQTLSWQAWAFTDLGRVDDAVAVARRLAQNPNGIDEAVAVTRRGGQIGGNQAAQRPNAAFAASRTFLRAGLKEEAEAFIRRPDLATDNLRLFAQLGIGRPAEALTYLQPAAVSSREIHYLLFLPEFDSVRDDPRFQQVLKILGLGDAHARAQAWRAAHPSGRTEMKP